MKTFHYLYSLVLIASLISLVFCVAQLYRATDKILNRLDLPNPHKDLAQQVKPVDTPLQREQDLPYKLFINWTDIFLGEGSYRLNSDFQNRSSEPVVIFKTNFGANHRIMIQNEAGQEPSLTESGRREKEYFDNWPNRDRSIAVTVHSGNSDRETIDLHNLYDLKPGKYRLKVRFRDSLWSSAPRPGMQRKSTGVDIMSNEIMFEVK